MSFSPNNKFLTPFSMNTIDVYSTPQCGFCKTLKTKLDAQNMAYTAHDITPE